MGKICTPAEIGEWLESAGLVCCERRVCRVVLDMQVGKPVKVYIEEHGTNKMLSVKPPDLSGAVVEWAGDIDIRVGETLCSGR